MINLPVKTKQFKVPLKPEPGSFWEDRGDRFHCGVDIYCKENSKVFATETGKVIRIGLATTPKINPYWNKTYYILIKNRSGFYCKYAELKTVNVKENEKVLAGSFIGKVGNVINLSKLNKNVPEYIKNLKSPSMLHIELYKSLPPKNWKLYLGGNYFNCKKPKILVDPTKYLLSIQNENCK